MSVKQELYSKVSSAFADEVYNLYLKERYGINYCNKTDINAIESTNRLKNLFYFKTFFQPDGFLDKYNSYKDKCTDVCSMASIIEKINAL